MSTAKIAITLEKEIVEQIDRWVQEKKYPNRSKAIQEAVKERWPVGVTPGSSRKQQS